jgi:hypothetical protein
VLRLYRDVRAPKISIEKGYGDPKGQHPNC